MTSINFVSMVQTKEPVRLRPATITDVETLFAIRCSVEENHQSREELVELGITPASVAEMIAGGEFACLIAEIEGKPVGFAMADYKEAYLFALFVRPEAEKRGVGSLLLRETEKMLAMRGLKSVYLVTGADESLRAVGFYKKQGWQITGTLDDGQLRFEKSLV